MQIIVDGRQSTTEFKICAYLNIVTGMKADRHKVLREKSLGIFPN